MSLFPILKYNLLLLPVFLLGLSLIDAGGETQKTRKKFNYNTTSIVSNKEKYQALKAFFNEHKETLIKEAPKETLLLFKKEVAAWQEKRKAVKAALAEEQEGKQATSPEESIPRDKFYDLVIDLAKGLSDTVKLVIKGLEPGAKITNTDEIQEISGQFLPTANICEDIKASLQPILDNVNVGDDANEVYQAIKKVFDSYLDKDVLKKKYKGHKKEDEESIRSGMIEGEDLQKLLDKGVAADDHKTEEERKKEQEELDKEFKKVYADWYKETVDKVLKIGADHKDQELSSSVLILHLSKYEKIWSASQPELSTKLCDNITSEIKKEQLTGKEFVSILHTALTKENYEKTIGPKLLFLRWKKSAVLPNISPFASVIEMNAEDNPETAFLALHADWYKEVFGALDTLAQEEKSITENTRFYKAKVLDSLKNVFSSNPGREPLAPYLEESFKQLKSATPTLRELNQAWRAALNKMVIEGDSLDNIFNQFEKKYPGNNALKQAIQTISLPSMQEVQSAFDTNNQYIYVPPKLAAGEKIDIIATMNDGTELALKLSTGIDKSGDTIYVKPVDIELAGVKTGSRQYDFSVAGFNATQGRGNGGEWTSNFEFTIQFEKEMGEETLSNEETKGKEFTDTSEYTDTKGTTYEYSREGGLSEILQYTHTESNGSYEEKTTGGSTALSRSTQTTKGQSQTSNLGSDKGYFNCTGILDSIYMAEEGVAKVSAVLSASPNFSKGFTIQVEGSTQTIKATK